MSLEKPRPLAVLLMSQIFLVMLPLLLVGAWGVYFAMRISYREQSLDVVSKYNSDRVRVEEQVFDVISKNHKILADAYLEGLSIWKNRDPVADFERVMERFPDKSWRTRQRGFDGLREASSWLGHEAPTADEMRSVLIELSVINHFGPAFLPGFADTFFVGRKNSITLFWPEFPNWVHSLSSNFDMTAEQYFQVSTAAANPARKMALTGLYLDRISNMWLVSAVTPVEDAEGRHLTSVGHDLRMNEVIERTGADFYPGTENMILRTDGRIVVHMGAAATMNRLGRSISVSEYGDPILMEVFDHIKDLPDKKMVSALSDRSYMIANRMADTDWIYVTRVPLSALDNTPKWMLNFSLIQSFMVVLLMLAGVTWVLRRRILKPLAIVLSITRRIGEGDYRWKKPRFRDLELTQLIDSMKSMTEAIEDRDRRLLSYSNHLESLVDERTKQITREQARLIQAAKMATLGEMAGSIAHEINNPLASIELSAVSLQRRLKTQGLDPAHLETLEGIQKMTARMAKIVKGLRQYSRDSSKDPKEPAPVRAIVEDSLALCQSKLSRYGVDVRTTFYLPTDQKINCRSVEVSQVLVNLIGNSVDAITELEHRWVKVDVWLENTGTSICISVTDSGPRISQELAEKIMLPFFTTKPVGSGTGLGLSISRSLIESHGGSLRLDMDSPTTRFEIHLPVI